MKISPNPMPALRAATTAQVNEWFEKQARPNREAAWAAKRAVAKAGQPYTDEFNQEASLRGITSDAFASLVLSKPDVTANRELHRQRVMAAIDNSKTPDDLAALSKDVSKI